jgi:hypothetical protein
MLTMEGYRGDGKRFATGQMAMVQDRPDKYSWGVSFAQVARLYCQAQGTLGIITKAAVTVKAKMKKNEVLLFECRNVQQATKALKQFLATEEPHEIFAVNKTYLAEILGLKSGAGLAAWTVVIVNRGIQDAEVTYKKKDMTVIAKQLGGKLMTGLKGVKGAPEKILSLISCPTGPALHTDKKEWVPIVSIATAKQIHDHTGLMPKGSGSIIMPLQAGGCFYYQPDLRFREADIEAQRTLYIKICEKLLKAGVVFPRPSNLIAKQVAKSNPANTKLLKSIKQAVDPKNIMNPGKLGL